MSKASDKHLAMMIKAVKLDMAGRYPGAGKPKLSPEAMECLREGDWAGVAVAYLHDIIEGRRVTVGREALRHLCDWVEHPDNFARPYIQDLIVRFNAASKRLLAEVEAEMRQPNRAEKRAARRKGA